MISKKLKLKFPEFNFICFPHPNLKKKLRFEDSKIRYLPCKDKDLIISSHRTNKGYQLFEEGFNVIYFGSDLYTHYKPYEDQHLSIKYANNSDNLITFLNIFLKK